MFAPDPRRILSRIAGEPAPGNAVTLLRDARENYPAWMEAIRSARRVIHFENFIVADDETGRMFAEALMERARAGVRVRILYDWLGCVARAPRRFWAMLREAGVEARPFNPLSLDAPAWFRRDHRKILTVDGRIGFISGLCVSDAWRGRRPGRQPWRDTGVAIRGPAVARIDDAFGQAWSLAGAPLPDDPPAEAAQPMGDRTVHVAVGRPGERRAYRLDLFAAAAARKRLWITDAYFVPTTAYAQALGEAAQDGVDVRLLVPGRSDVPLLPAFVRAAYRPLIERGVRVYEWNGTMLHAKTAVMDGLAARVGSTNLNPTSWFGNYEIDVVVADAGFAAEMEAMFEEDLTAATEIVPVGRRLMRLPRLPVSAVDEEEPATDLSAAMLGLRRSVGAALGHSDSLSRLESRSLGLAVFLLLTLSVLVTLVPSLVVSPVVIMLVWIAAALLRRLVLARREAREERAIERKERRSAEGLGREAAE